MDSNKNKICRLCLNTCNEHFEIIQYVSKEMLEIIRVNMDFEISDDCVVKCKTCTEMLEKCFEFKSVCLHTEDKLIVFIESKNITRASMTQVYLEDMQNKKLDHFDITEICRFCMKPTTTYFDLDEIVDEYFSDMLQKFLPEVTLYFTNNPVSCSNCLDTLKSCFTFLKCLHLVEEHIKAYYEAEVKSGKVELNNVVQHKLRNILTEKIFIEEQLVEVYFSGLVTKNCIKNESKIRCCRIVRLEKNMEEISNSENYCLESSEKDRCKQNDIKSEEIEIKTDGTVDSDDDSEDDRESRDAVEEQANSITNVRLVEETKADTNVRELVVILKRENFNRNEEYAKKFKCSYCKFKSSYRRSLNTHLSGIHGMRLLSCHHCGYKTFNENCLMKHQAVHGDKTKFECSQCQKIYNTKRNIDNHFLIKHKNLCDSVTSKIHSCNSLFQHINSKHSRLEKYQCNYCLHTCFQKQALEKHISSVHLKLRPLICRDCKKTFNQKITLDYHIVANHQKNVGLMKTVTNKIYNCDQCTYRCVCKMNMTRHMKTHKKTKT